jgi:hypothetical protein
MVNDPDQVPMYADECPECGEIVSGGDANKDAWDLGLLCCDRCWKTGNILDLQIVRLPDKITDALALLKMEGKP